MVDLRMHYTAPLTQDWHARSRSNNLAQLLDRPALHAGIPFDIAGWLRLASSKPSELDWPIAVRNMAVQRKGRRLHFLHGTGLSVEQGTVVAHYVVHYEDGS